MVLEVEGDCVSSEKSTHQRGDWHQTCLQKEMGMIRKESPRETAGLTPRYEVGETMQKILKVEVLAEYLSAFNSPDDDVMKCAGCVYSSFSRHACLNSRPEEEKQFIVSWMSPICEASSAGKGEIHEIMGVP